MEKLIALGTGAARAERYYNTCFLLEGAHGRLLVDGGGGNAILPRLRAAGPGVNGINDIFVSHEHIDHLLGIIWLIRMSSTGWLAGRRKTPLTIHCHQHLSDKIRTICELTLSAKQQSPFGTGILFRPVASGETRVIAEHSVTFFDIRSKKAEQFGFRMLSPTGQSIVFCGDEPYHGDDFSLLENADWLLHESFCLEKDEPQYNPHAIGHGTVREAAVFADRVKAKRLILWHTEDGDSYGRRKELYTSEAEKFFHGSVFVPDDMEILDLGEKAS